jgi:hypothetical protein
MPRKHPSQEMEKLGESCAEVENARSRPWRGSCGGSVEPRSQTPVGELQVACRQTFERQPRLPAEGELLPSNGGNFKPLCSHSPLDLPASHDGLGWIGTANLERRLCTRQSRDRTTHTNYFIFIRCIESVELSRQDIPERGGDAETRQPQVTQRNATQLRTQAHIGGTVPTVEPESLDQNRTTTSTPDIKRTTPGSRLAGAVMSSLACASCPLVPVPSESANTSSSPIDPLAR